MTISALLFYGGLAVAGFAVAVGIFSIIALKLKGAKLRRRLYEEYGEEVNHASDNRFHL